MTVTYSTHVVAAGETLSKIAQNLWGDSARWKSLADANAIVAPYTIRAGQKLLVPVTNSPAIQLPIIKGVSLNIWPLILVLTAAAWLLFGARRR